MQGTELIVRTERDAIILEVIPAAAFQSDFPISFLQDYIHWLNPVTCEIEFRPREEAWSQSLSHWKLRTKNDPFSMEQANLRLIDIHSPVARAVHSILKPLEELSSTHIMLDEAEGRLAVHLPRYGLDFWLEPTPRRLASKQFRDMFVDDNQSIGTFTGLANKLILRDPLGSRMMIVPHGVVSFRRSGNHVCVNISNSSRNQAAHHIYFIDPHLQRLRGNGSLTSKLFQSYLHALTSHCLIDDLTARTGTEESLTLLRGAWTKSSLQFDEEDIHLLRSIARLTPEIAYYPDHLKVMQQIKWSNLPVLSQHYEFVRRVRDIIEHTRSLDMFRSDCVALAHIDTEVNEPLLERMAARQSTYRVDGFGANAQRSAFDVAYSPPYKTGLAERESSVVEIVRLADSWSTSLRPAKSLRDVISQLPKPIGGINLEGSKGIKLQFGLNWLQECNALLSQFFGQLLRLLAKTDPASHRNKLIFFLSTLAFAEDIPESVCQMLLAFATAPQLRALTGRFPHFARFSLGDGSAASEDQLLSIASKHTKELDQCPENELPRKGKEKDKSYLQRQDQQYRTNCQSKADSFASQLMAQWPTNTISRPSSDLRTYIMLDQAFEEAQHLFQSWSRNKELYQFIDEAQTILSGLSTTKHSIAHHILTFATIAGPPPHPYITFEDLIADPAPVLATFQPKHDGAHTKLHQLLTHLSRDQNGDYEQEYIKDLHASLEAHQENDQGEVSDVSFSEQKLREHLERRKANVLGSRQSLQKHFFRKDNPSENLAVLVGMIPRTSTTSLLSRLSSRQISQLTTGWRESFIQLGLTISAAQHAERLLKCRKDRIDFHAELSSQACSGWLPISRPDWLLFELENNLRIRRVQAQIAEEMINPRGGKNLLLQLNMGEGKSSVITPIIAANLANGEELVRVVVLKQLSAQMHRILSHALGGMLNRAVIQMPFSRSLSPTVNQAQSIQQAYETCMNSGGIILQQPEHITSFELMVHDSYLMERIDLAEALWSTQRWLNKHSRDVLDESDEILSPHFELVYTTGMQHAVEFAPSRWMVTQRTLSVIARLVPNFAAQNETGFILSDGNGGEFPHMRIIDEAIGTRFLRDTIHCICQEGMHGLPVSHLSSSQKDVLEEYLANPDAGENVIESLTHIFRDDDMKKTLLILRGLFAHGVLLFAFQRKRWRVDYGLDPSRTPLAVPYRAKDCPELRSEFSHPEVIIVLTCLSYYYCGVTDEQLRRCFETLAAQDDAEDEYACWVRDANGLATDFRTLTGVNWQDPIERLEKLHPCFRRAKSVIDFYTTRFVFRPKLGEFPSKLAASSWNLAKSKHHPTTGFSGTCDSKHILPLSIEQDNSPGQRHTNAAVLECLLASQNQVWSLTSDSAFQAVSADLLLRKIISAQPAIRVIIDVGAQILEWTNEQTARQWLSRVSKLEVDAAIFFNDSDEIVVLDHSGKVEILATSPFANNLERCVVYLDEVHTRGTDLKLPVDFRAAVTLSVGLTKDRLVQGVFDPLRGSCFLTFSPT